jgi:uncharacterized protein YbjT (DUF2867 family)
MFVLAGVTGHVGSVAASELLRRNQRVRVVVRDAEKGTTWSKRGAEVAVASLEDPKALATALKGASAFFTLLPLNDQASDFFVAQTKTADAIAAAVRASDVRHVALLSSLGANQPSGTGPIRGLHYVENALRATGVALSAIRACAFQENVAMALGPAKQQGIFASFAASADFSMPMVATKDIGKVVSQVLLESPRKSEIIDLIGPAYSNRQVAQMLGAALGKTLQLVEIPPAGAVDALMKGGLPKPLAELFAEMYDAGNKGLLAPVGERLVQGHTTLEETIQQVVASSGGSAH